MESNREKLSVGRIVTYLLGILTVSLGIVLCKKCGLGISPISSIPFVLTEVTPLSFGTLTTLFHFVNTAAQMLMTKKLKDGKLWLQVPLAFVFGWVIDLLNTFVLIDNTSLLQQLFVLALSIFFTALGMVMMIDQNLIQNPPDGTVKQISLLRGVELGNVKVVYDITCVLLSALLGLAFLHEIKGFGLATILSAILVGPTVIGIRAVHQAIIHG